MAICNKNEAAYPNTGAEKRTSSSRLHQRKQSVIVSPTQKKKEITSVVSVLLTFTEPLCRLLHMSG